MGKRSLREAASAEAVRKIPRSRPRSAFLRRKAGTGSRGSELATLVIGILAFVFVVWMVVTLS